MIIDLDEGKGADLVVYISQTEQQEDGDAQHGVEDDRHTHLQRILVLFQTDDKTLLVDDDDLGLVELSLARGGKAKPGGCLHLYWNQVYANRNQCRAK